MCVGVAYPQIWGKKSNAGGRGIPSDLRGNKQGARGIPHQSPLQHTCDSGVRNAQRFEGGNGGGDVAYPQIWGGNWNGDVEFHIKFPCFVGVCGGVYRIHFQAL